MDGCRRWRPAHGVFGDQLVWVTHSWSHLPTPLEGLLTSEEEEARKRVGKLSHENSCYRASFTRQTRGPCTSLKSLLLRQQVPYPPMPVFEKVIESRFLEDKPEVADLQVVDNVVVDNYYLPEKSSGC